MKFLKTTIILLILGCTISNASNYRAVAYLPSYRTSILSDINFDLITHVMWAFANPDEQGQIIHSSSIDNFVNTVHNNNALAILSIGGGGDYSWGNKVSIYKTLWETPESRTAFVHELMNYLREHNFDGLDNDIEGNALALSNFNVFSRELGDSLHASGFEYSAAIGVNGSWGVNKWDTSTLQKLDFIMTMSYGGFGYWNWSSQTDDHTFTKMKNDMEYFLNNRGIAAHKIVGGIPFYSVEFPNSAQSSYDQFHQTICSIYSDPQFDTQDPFHSDTLETTEGHVVYINSIETIEKKMDFCEDFGGIMIWEIGQDCYNGTVSLQDSMYAHMVEFKVGVNDLKNVLNFDLYPNPSLEKISLKFGQNSSLNFEIYNTLVEKVKVGSVRNNQSIDIAELSEGHYVIKLSNDQLEYGNLSFIKK